MESGRVNSGHLFRDGETRFSHGFSGMLQEASGWDEILQTFRVVLVCFFFLRSFMVYVSSIEEGSAFDFDSGVVGVNAGLLLLAAGPGESYLTSWSSLS